MTVNCRVKNIAGRVYRYPVITVNMTDRDIIERVASMFGNKVFTLKPGPNSKLTPYRAVITGGRAVKWMKELHPFMGERRKKRIDECLAEWDERPSANESRRELMRKRVQTRVRLNNGQLGNND